MACKCARLERPTLRALPFGPEDIRAMMIALKLALLRTERSRELVARKVIEFAMAGERDSRSLCELVRQSRQKTWRHKLKSCPDRGSR